MSGGTIAWVLVAGAAIAIICWREARWRRALRRVQQALDGNGENAAADLEAVARGIAELRGQAADRERQGSLRKLFEFLLDEIQQGVVIVDGQLRIQFANHTLSEIFQGQEFEKGKTLIEEFRDHQIADAVRLALEKNERCVQEVRTFGSGGGPGLSERVYLVETAPLPASAGHGAWLMIHEITEQLMTEQIRKDFVANASHELRTPLTLINGYIETLQSGAIKDQGGVKRCLDIMEKHGKRLVRIIEDMLSISRLEGTSANLRMEPFNVRHCVEEVLEHLSQLIESRRPDITLEFPPDGGTLNGDRFYWDQVFMNLIENALKENTKPGLRVRVAGLWREENCEISVSDNGVGIPAHDLPFVFKRFFRGNKHHAKEVKGTGLGLSIVKRAVEAHGGTIELTSVPGVETVFKMVVPLKRELPPRIEPKVLTDPQPGGPGAISRRISNGLAAAI